MGGVLACVLALCLTLFLSSPQFFTVVMMVSGLFFIAMPLAVVGTNFTAMYAARNSARFGAHSRATPPRHSPTPPIRAQV